jgi:polyribonucleotide 5'-hydroxyl-kinase
MISYSNAHFALENLRQNAIAEGREGPRVLVVGPENAGKTSLVKLLTAYATRMGRQPIVVNLDSREGMLSIPGSLMATTFSSIIDVEEGWGSSPTSGPSLVPIKLPLVYYYGLPSPEDNKKIYKPLVTRLALSVSSRLMEDEAAKEAGCLIDTPGAISQGKANYDIIQHVVSEFSGAHTPYISKTIPKQQCICSQCPPCTGVRAAIQRHAPALRRHQDQQ